MTISSYCKKYSNMIYILIVSTLFVYFFSYSTSPWVPGYFGGDSAQFQTIGKAWTLGKIPYRDMFDHKGPVIFLINMLGYSLTGTSSGIMIIQIVFLSVSCGIIYWISQLSVRDRRYGMAVILLSLMLLTFVYGGGNFTEEYCLPFICMSMYFQVKYLSALDHDISVSKKHSPFLALLYGVSFGVCVMSKMTNGVGICGGVFVITIHLIMDGQWKNLCGNAAGFILGIVTVIAPFSIYFFMKGVFSEFIYASIGYNFAYQQNMSSWLLGSKVTGKELVNFIIFGFAFYTIFITANLAWHGKRKHLALYCILVGVLETYLYLSGALFNQYYIISIPQLALLLNEVMLLKKGRLSGNFARALCICAVGLGCMFCCFRGKAVFDMHNGYKNRSEVYESLLDEIPEEEKDSFVAWGNNEFKELYLRNDLMPCYKYHVIQPWHSSFSEFTKEDIYNTFKYGDARWILANAESTSLIKDILDEDYAEKDHVDRFILYQRVK